MSLVLMAIFGFLHYLLSSRIDYWTTLSILGFKSEVSLLFIQNPLGFRLINILLGVGLICTPLVGNDQLFFIGIFALVIVWFASGITGRKQAYNMYREIMRDSNSEDKSDDEIAEIVKDLIRMGR